MPHGQPHTPPGLLQQNPLDDPAYEYTGALSLAPFRQRKSLDIDETSDDGLEYAIPGLIRGPLNAAVRMGQMALGKRPPGLILGDVMDFSPAGLLNRIPVGALGMNVFQGSPHRYGPEGAAESLQHIGKGEGAQAYGWGRYDAGKEAVAVDYRNALTPPPGVKVGGRTMTPFEFENNLRLKSLKKYPDMPVQEVERHSGNAARMIFDRAEKIKNIDGNDNVLMRSFLDSQSKKDDGLSKILRVARDEMPTAKWVVEKGNLYKHDLPDEDVARYLDWDKPLSEQPESVRKALEKFGYKADPKGLQEYDKALLDALYNNPKRDLPELPADPTGKEIYEAITRREVDRVRDMPGSRLDNIAGSDPSQAASLALGDAGIPGLKYLDQGSRGASSQGTRNYVTWDQDVLDRMKLLQRNDETFKSTPGVPAMGLLSRDGDSASNSPTGLLGEPAGWNRQFLLRKMEDRKRMAMEEALQKNFRSGMSGGVI